jgi:ADP-ribose pyrophosphatase YjhB (NUDIX family)
VGGFSLVAAAKIMAQEVFKHLRENKSGLTEIIFCLYDDEAYGIFQKNVNQYLEYILHKISQGPFVTIDAIIELTDGIILIERSNPPFGWALPGGFVDVGESLEDAVKREAKEETNLDLTEIKQFHTYSQPNRDPRFHTVGTVFIANAKGTPKAGDDAKGLKIVKYRDLLKLDYAFDHKKIIQDYLKTRKSG